MSSLSERNLTQENQRAGESVDSFITDLFGLARRCNFGALKEELIRDRIIVGLQNRELSENFNLFRISPWKKLPI